VLINLIHIGQLNLLRQLPGYRFVVPEHVTGEVQSRFALSRRYAYIAGLEEKQKTQMSGQLDKDE
jgi:hypothetical protein